MREFGHFRFGEVGKRLRQHSIKRRRGPQTWADVTLRRRDPLASFSTKSMEQKTSLQHRSRLKLSVGSPHNPQSGSVGANCSSEIYLHGATYEMLRDVTGIHCLAGLIFLRNRQRPDLQQPGLHRPRPGRGGVARTSCLARADVFEGAHSGRPLLSTSFCNMRIGMRTDLQDGFETGHAPFRVHLDSAHSPGRAVQAHADGRPQISAQQHYRSAPRHPSPHSASWSSMNISNHRSDT